MKTADADPQYSQLSRIFWTGVAILAVWLVVLIAAALWKPDPYAKGGILVVQLMFMGRFVSNATGVQMGFDDAYLLFQSIFQDVWLTLVFLPVLTRAFQGGTPRGWIGRIIALTRRGAEVNRRVVEPFGAVGLWCFVFLPLWGTEVMVGVFMGFIMGLRIWLNLFVNLSSHTISCFAMVWLSQEMHDLAATVGSGYTKYLVWVVIAAVIALTLAYSRYVAWRNRKRLEIPPKSEPS